ncbi:hypothetical protein CLV59_10914 [Chitinophaga dinghuensis]|uniref:Lamin tail-like protein n=1 Tax=Chitinophaga dinghuensis TaxID=1539050 RepID=A0A327VL06_9BACT|nr:lamin tail domain-containing protein [Chitinophaga dinghuensis]RAJ75400.1 hypothetical protein CLV59_10914 [Chitinophaga dinghuensis]
MLTTIVCCAISLAITQPVSDTILPAIYDIVIHEVMAKPSPVKGLPAVEYIELYNRNAATVLLKNCILAVNKREVILPNIALPPAGILLLCNSAATDSFVAPLIAGIDKWPPIPDDTGLIALYSSNRKVLHAVNYNKSWYGRADRANGGFSLEMINAAIPCAGKSNWCASTAVAGGTPGMANAASSDWDDKQLPDLLYAGIVDKNNLSLTFAQSIDSSLAADVGNFKLIDKSTGIPLQPAAVRVMPPLLNTIQLQLAQPLENGHGYTVLVAGIRNCQGRESIVYRSLETGWPELPGIGGVMVSEILFHPVSTYPSFIEIVNRTATMVDLKSLRLQNVRADGRLDAAKAVSAESRLLAPGHCVALTTDQQRLCSRYNCRDASAFLETTLPTTYVGEGRLRLLRADSLLLDEVMYNENWHFPLLTDSEGASLERITFEHPAIGQGDWQSTAGTYGYATPGWLPEQQMDSDALVFQNLTPVFTPENIAGNNQAKCSYNLGNQQWVGNAWIYDVTGRPIRTLARNMLVSGNGFLTWDGYDEKKVLLPAGVYIFLFEIFNLKGRTRRWKQAVVMARNLN